MLIYLNFRFFLVSSFTLETPINFISLSISLRKLDKLFSDLSNYLQLPLREYKGVRNHYWVYGIMLKKPELKVELTEYLLNNDIETRPFFYPLHLQPVLPQIYKDLTIKPIVSEKLYESGLYIPIGSHLTQKKQRYISNKIHNFFN